MKVPHASEQDLLQAVFADGLTTRDFVTDLSGRGIGLGAVRTACDEAGGEIRVRSGTAGAFTFLIPLGPAVASAIAPVRPPGQLSQSRMTARSS